MLEVDQMRSVVLAAQREKRVWLDKEGVDERRPIANPDKALHFFRSFLVQLQSFLT